MVWVAKLFWKSCLSCKSIHFSYMNGRIPVKSSPYGAFPTEAEWSESTHEPWHARGRLEVYANSKASGGIAQMCNPSRTFAVCTHNLWAQKSQTEREREPGISVLLAIKCSKVKHTLDSLLCVVAHMKIKWTHVMLSVTEYFFIFIYKKTFCGHKIESSHLRQF